MGKGLAGRIALELGLDTSSLRTELSQVSGDVSKQVGNISSNASKQITNAFSGITKQIGTALSIGAITLFGKSCMDLGSDLTEVQNVVDTSFKSMSSYVNSFAQDAMKNFGLSETVAKQYMGTIGAMNNAFGFTEKASLDMAKAVTGLTGDVASFYNLDSDEAFTKLKSIWTGETETLKDLGVVMTQTALDQYALNNGLGKTTANMTEQEKVMLRFQYVTSALSDASGDFIKTQDSWANQTRVLQLQMESFKATIGQGLINLFTPLLQMLNDLALKATEAAGSFKAFTEAITGTQASGGGNTAKAMQAITQSAQDASQSVEETTTSLASFDKMNKLGDTSAGSSGGSSVDTSTPVDTSAVQESTRATSGLMKELEKIKKSVKNIWNTAKNIWDIFKKGFTLSFQSEGLEKIQESIKSILQSLKGIFTDKELTGAVSEYASNFILNLGKITGAATSIGLSIGTLLIGGIEKYLSQNTGRIKQYIIDMLSISGEIQTIYADYCMALADIFTVFESPQAQQIVADCLAIFQEAFFTVTKIGGKFGRDLLDVIAATIVKNKDKIKKALTETIKPIGDIVATVKEIFIEVSDTMNSTYDEHIKPMFESFKNGFSEIAGVVLDKYTEYIAPVLDHLATEFQRVKNEALIPLMTKFNEVVGSVSDMVSVLWTNILQPIVTWLISTMAPQIADVLKVLISNARQCITNISKVLNNIWDVFKGFIKFFTGVFSGDWKKAWQGIKEVFKASMDGIKNIAKTFKDIVVGIFKLAYTKIKNVFGRVDEWFGGIFTKAWTGIKNAFSGTKKFFGGIWSGIKSAFSNVTDWFKNVFQSAWEGVKAVFSTGGKVFSGIKEGISDVFKTVVNTLISGINKVIAFPFKKINGMLNDIRNVSVAGVKPFSGLWDEDPLPVPEIPKLANGAYVKPNTPQLAMIGDNRHQGELVAPEDKLKSLLDEAKSGDSRAMDMILEYLKLIYEKDTNAYVELQGDMNKLFRSMQVEGQKYYNRTKRSPFPT